eukprot:3724069-Alexandrium_andersonii.AAC.1
MLNDVRRGASSERARLHRSEQPLHWLTLWLKLVRVPTPNWMRLQSEPRQSAEWSSPRPGTARSGGPP